MWDRAKKKELGYTEPGTRVFMDGREKLVGKDWERRKLELWARCAGRCEYINPWVGEGKYRCKDEAHDPHHVQPRSKGRDDRLSNLQGLCRFHHMLIDARKTRFGERAA